MPVIDRRERPADDEARKQVEDGSEVEPAVAGDELGRIADSALIGPLGLKLPGE
jgi:hypothetical protein